MTDSTHGDMHFPIILNGLDYLHSSLSALADQPKGRDLKYAVLHLQLGTETLLKARLELHDPKLVWSKPQTFDETKHRLGSFHSVGVGKALERLRDDVQIAAPLDPEDTDLKALADLRNRLTHYGASDTALAVESRTVPVLKKLLPFLDDELLPHAHSDDAAAAHELMEQIRPLIGKVGSFVQLRLDELEATLKDATERTLRCVSCGHFTLVVEGGGGKEAFLCLLCGKDHGTIADMVELYGVGSFYEAHTQGGEPPAYECAECGSGDATVLPVETADSSTALVCLFGGHVLEDVCEQCRRACNSDLADMCSDCVGNRFARF